MGVLGAFAVTVWLCGPRAAAVLAAKFETSGEHSPKVALDRVGFVALPDWLERPMLLEVSEACAPWLSDEIGILDEASGKKLRDGLLTVPWVRDVRVERVFPDKFRLHLSLRRPVLEVRTAADEPLCVVDADGIVLPHVEVALPIVRLYREGGSPTMTVAPGQRCAEPRVRTAVGVVNEWHEQLAPLVDDCPALVEVDTTNLGERWIRGPEYPEVRVTLRRGDGEPVVFGYGRPVDTTLSRVPVRVKAAVLAKVLDAHAGLDGLVAGDLRFQRRWADYLQPRAEGVRDPFGPWKELPLPDGR